MEVGPGRLEVELVGRAQGELSTPEFSIPVNLEDSIPASLEFLEASTPANLEVSIPASPEFLDSLEVSIPASPDFPEFLEVSLEYPEVSLECLVSSLLLLPLLPSSLKKVWWLETV